ncbi:MAG: hypothetical protein MJ105_01795 [Lachnospiraceae bacterium]|nr:hypothetical protein [Lachnospiraceae bacterium]
MTAKLSLTKEEIFEEAEICFNNCKLLVECLADAAAKMDPEFSKENAMVQFELMVQSLLFSQALADGVFSEEEKEFIKKLSKDNNLFDYIIPEEGKSMTMDEAFALDIEKQKEIAEAINTALNNFADDFIMPLAMLDAAVATNVLFDLSTDLSNLSVLLGAIDGEITEDELEAFTNYCDELIIGKWKDIKNIAEDIMEEATETADKAADEE